MITIFNRKQVLSTMNFDQYANARDDLVKAGIDFRVATKGRNGKHTMPRTYNVKGKSIINTGIVYDLYVHEKDYNKAVAVINRGRV